MNLFPSQVAFPKYFNSGNEKLMRLPSSLFVRLVPSEVSQKELALLALGHKSILKQPFHFGIGYSNWLGSDYMLSFGWLFDEQHLNHLDCRCGIPAPQYNLDRQNLSVNDSSKCKHFFVHYKQS